MSERFEIKPDHRAILESAGLTDLDSWLAFTDGKVRSRHVDRRTLEFSLPDPQTGRPVPMFAKLHLSVPLWPRCVAFLKFKGVLPSNPVNEWNWLGRLADAGIDAMEPVAVGERRRLGMPRQGVLVVRAVPGSESLGSLLNSRPELRDDRDLWRTVVRLLEGLWDHRICWPDLQPKHLFPVQADEGWRVHIVDVERMSRDLTAGRWMTAACISNFVRSLPADLREPHLRPLLEAEGLWEHVPAHARTGRQRRVDDRRAWLDAGLNVETRGRLQVNAAWRDSLDRAGLDSLDSVMDFQGGDSLAKPGLPPHRQRDRVQLGDGRVIYLKRYRPGAGERLKRLLRWQCGASEAADELRALWWLIGGGISVPEPVLFGQDRGRLATGRSCLALADLSNAQSLERWAPGQGGIVPARRRELIDRLADFVRHFHALGTVHRDLYLCHIFIEQNPAGPLFHLIDLARVFQPVRWRRRRWRVKDLAQLSYAAGQYAPYLTRGDRIRFLRRYLGVDRLDAAARSLVRSVARKQASIERRTRST